MRRGAGALPGRAGQHLARSFAELDGAEALQGDAPEPWAEAMLRLHRAHPMRLLGGCCGTDGRHMAALAARLTAEAGN